MIVNSLYIHTYTSKVEKRTLSRQLKEQQTIFERHNVRCFLGACMQWLKFNESNINCNN